MIVHKIIKHCLAALGLKQKKKKDQYKYNFFCFETRLDGSLVEAGLLEIVHYCFLGLCSVSVQVRVITPIWDYIPPLCRRFHHSDISPAMVAWSVNLTTHLCDVPVFRIRAISHPDILGSVTHETYSSILTLEFSRFSCGELWWLHPPLTCLLDMQIVVGWSAGRPVLMWERMRLKTSGDVRG